MGPTTKKVYDVFRVVVKLGWVEKIIIFKV